MYYYICPRIGTGTSSDPYRPDVDNGTSFVGQVGLDNMYIIATPTLQSVKCGRTQIPPITALQNACNSKGINYNDVINIHKRKSLFRLLWQLVTCPMLAPSVYTGTSISVSVSSVVASTLIDVTVPVVKTSCDIVGVVANTSADANVPFVSAVRNIIVNQVIAGITAQGIVPNVVLNALEIIGRIELKGQRDLYVYLKGSRDLNIHLKGSYKTRNKRKFYYLMIVEYFLPCKKLEDRMMW